MRGSFVLVFACPNNLPIIGRPNPAAAPTLAWVCRRSCMRKLGLAVQESVKAAMRERGLNVDDVDHGYDFYVTPVEVRDDDTEDLSSHFQVGGYKVEVKATTTGEA